MGCRVARAVRLHGDRCHYSCLSRLAVYLLVLHQKKAEQMPICEGVLSMCTAVVGQGYLPEVLQYCGIWSLPASHRHLTTTLAARTKRRC